MRLCVDYERESVARAVRSSLEDLGGIGKFIGKDKTVLLKPNLLAGTEASKMVTTHPEVMRAVMSVLADFGAKMIVGDSPAIGSAKSVARKAGILEVAEYFGAEVISLSEPCLAKTGETCTYKHIELAREALEAEAIINICKVKTHGAMSLTLGVKNLFGCVVGRAKTQWHLKAGRDAIAFARMLVDIYATLKPALTIADGIIGMEGNGPSSGKIRKFGWVAASPDAVAMDRVITSILNAPIEKNYVLEAARQAGVGETELSEISVIGDSIEAAQAAGGTDKRPIELPSAPIERGLPGKILRRILKRSFTPEPFINHDQCTLCGTCINACPPEVMSFVASKKKGAKGAGKKVEIDRSGCIHCFCCQELCPEGVISIKSGKLAWLLSKPTSPAS